MVIYLDRQGLPVSDHSAQLNHRLHPRDGAFNALVNQILPVKTEKNIECHTFHVIICSTEWENQCLDNSVYSVTPERMRLGMGIPSTETRSDWALFIKATWRQSPLITITHPLRINIHYSVKLCVGNSWVDSSIFTAKSNPHLSLMVIYEINWIICWGKH